MNWPAHRSNFPAAETQKYFLSAATGPLHKKTHQAYTDFADKLYKTGDTHWTESLQTLDNTRELFRSYFNSPNKEDIAFGPNSSHNINIIALMLQQTHAKATIAMPDEEFPSSSLPFYHHGFNVKMFPTNSFIEDVQKLQPDFILCSAIQFSSGYKMDLQKLSELNIPIIINATQSLGAFATDVSQLNPISVVGSCHKWLCAGYGASVLYLRESFRNQHQWPLAGWLSVDDIESMSNQLGELTKETRAIETGVPPFATIAGLEAAMQVVLDIGVENISQRILELSDYLDKKLIERQLKTREQTPAKINRSGIIAIDYDNPEETVEKLAEKNMFLSARAGKIRIAVHYFNNTEDIDALIKEL